MESGGKNGNCSCSLVPSVIPMVCPPQEGPETFSSTSEEFIAQLFLALILEDSCY